MKSLCIKTNNSDLIKYLLGNLDSIELDNICFCCKKFKHYKNVIIHYFGNDNKLFTNKISSILSLLVIDELEPGLLESIIKNNYFYFDFNERKQILKLCFEITENDFYDTFDKKINFLYNSFYEFILENKSIVLQGFINFRDKDYLKILDNIVNEAVNNYIIEKEYLEFISLLKLYINSQDSGCKLIHIIYNNEESILLDENKEIISISKDILNTKYLSDISFSSNDYTLNSLLTLLPKKIYVHLIDCYIDEFVTTLKAIFEGRLTICTDCDICRLYSSTSKKNPNSF